MTAIKKCNQCGLYKPVNSLFWHKNGHIKDGFLNVCKQCINKTDIVRKRNPDKWNGRPAQLKARVDTLSDEYIKNQLYKQGIERKNITPLMIRKKKIAILSGRLYGSGKNNYMSFTELDKMKAGKP